MYIADRLNRGLETRLQRKIWGPEFTREDIQRELSILQDKCADRRYFEIVAHPDFIAYA